MDFVAFMFFSTIEGLSILALMLSMFSYHFTRFIVPSLFIVTLQNLQSYFIRNDFQLDNWVPLIHIFLFIAFLSLVIKIPFFASIIVTCSGYFVFAIVQAGLVELTPNGFFSLAELQSSAIKGYSLQVLTAAIVFLVAWLLNKKRIGFISDIAEKLKMKHEVLIVTTIVLLILVSLTVFLYFFSLKVHIALYLAAALFFIYYAYRKEIA